MEIDYSKLEELFKVFGLSLEIKNGKAYFREIGSERLLNTYDPHSLLLKRDVDFLFHNYTDSFIIGDRVKNPYKRFEVKIKELNGKYYFGYIIEDELLSPHDYQRNWLSYFGVREGDFDYKYEVVIRSRRDEKNPNGNYEIATEYRIFDDEISFVHSEDYEEENIHNISDCSLIFDNSSDEINIDGTYNNIGKESTVRLIDSSKHLKDIIGVLNPKLLEGYTQLSNEVLTSNVLRIMNKN